MCENQWIPAYAGVTAIVSQDTTMTAEHAAARVGPEFAEYYEQTQHVAENKDADFLEPSKYLKNRLLGE